MESQHPKAQLAEVHLAGPQEAPTAMEKPSAAPRVIHLNVVEIVMIRRLTMFVVRSPRADTPQGPHVQADLKQGLRQARGPCLLTWLS